MASGQDFVFPQYLQTFGALARSRRLPLSTIFEGCIGVGGISYAGAEKLKRFAVLPALAVYQRLSGLV